MNGKIWKISRVVHRRRGGGSGYRDKVRNMGHGDNRQKRG